MLLLDTNVLIYLLDGKRAVANLIKDKLWYISFINEIELLSKPDLSAAQTKATQALLNEMHYYWNERFYQRKNNWKL